MKKIEKLTPEQEALLPAFVDYGLQYGLNTSPCDRPKAEAAIRAHYAALNRPEPKLIIWLDSPHQGAIGAAMLAGTKFSGDQVRDQVWAQVRDQVRDQVWDQVYRCSYGCHDAAWLSFYAAFGLFGLDASRLHPLMRLAHHCGWWWSFERVAILTEKPTSIAWKDGKCVGVWYADGWGFGERVIAREVLGS